MSNRRDIHTADLSPVIHASGKNNKKTVFPYEAALLAP